MNIFSSKRRSNESGFTLVELLLWIAIVALIAFPVLRLIFGEGIRDLERQMFQYFGIGPFFQGFICFVLGCLALYLRFRPEIQKAKKNNRPLIRRPVKIFVLFSMAIAVLLIFMGIKLSTGAL